MIKYYDTGSKQSPTPSVNYNVANECGLHGFLNPYSP